MASELVLYIFFNRETEAEGEAEDEAAGTVVAGECNGTTTLPLL